MTEPAPRRSRFVGVTLPRTLRLHRHPAVDAVLVLVALAIAVGLLRSAVARPDRLVIASDSAQFDAAAALYNTRLLADTFRSRVTGTPRAQAAAACARGVPVTRERKVSARRRVL